jgi:hypothetical protein
MTQAESTSVLAKASAFSSRAAIVRDGDYLACMVAYRTYRYLRRFIIRHVVPHADGHIRRLLRVDELQRVAAVVARADASDAWAVAIWTHDLERHARERLWAMGGRFGRDPEVRLQLDRISFGMDLEVKVPSGRLQEDQAQWLLGHAALATLRRRFARARAVAAGMAKAGDATLHKDLLGRNLLALVGEVLDNGDLRFSAEEEPMRGVLMPASRPSKGDRRGAFEQALLDRRAQLCQCCVGPCLTFSWCDGWSVAASAIPDLAGGVGVRRHRLFVPGRPMFLLFAVPQGWCARMVDSPLQVHDTLPWKAIDTLRHAYTKHAQLNATRSAKLTVPALEKSKVDAVVLGSNFGRRQQ